MSRAGNMLVPFQSYFYPFSPPAFFLTTKDTKKARRTRRFFFGFRIWDFGLGKILLINF